MEKQKLYDRLIVGAGCLFFTASLYFSYDAGYGKGQQLANDYKYCQRQQQVLRELPPTGLHLDDLISPNLKISCREVTQLENYERHGNND